MEIKQSSSFSYIVLGALTIGASFLVILILILSHNVHIRIDSGPLLAVGLIYGISIIAVIALLHQWQEGPERARAMQSHKMLKIANETLSHFRQGFGPETLDEVADIILERSDVDAIVITDQDNILAAAGSRTPSPLALQRRSHMKEADGVQLFENMKDVGREDKGKLAWSGISVPLRVRDEALGTLEFLYEAPKKLSENRVTVARGIGQLLSTQLALSQIEKQQELAVRSELKALRAQINPHFLFNTLNTIAALCRTDPKTARVLIIQFAEFFRESLERQSQFTSLEEELKYVDSYLIFERARFGDRLHIKHRIADGARRLKLPSLVLQPLVENAVKHGMAAQGPLNIELAASVAGGNLYIQIVDDGVGIPAAGRPSNNEKGLGIGLTNVRERLQSLYGSAAFLDIKSEEGLGTEVTLRIPVNGSASED